MTIGSALTTFSTLSAGIHDLLAAIAIIAAGVWALYSFRALGQIARSRAEIHNIELDHKKAEEEIHRLRQDKDIGAVIKITISAATEAIDSTQDVYVSAVVQIENCGNRHAHLDFGKDRTPFVIYSATIAAEGSLSYREIAALPVPLAINPNQASPSILVRAGGAERLPFCFKLPSSGLFLFVFTARLPEDEQEIVRKYGFTFAGNWTGKQYFLAK